MLLHFEAVDYITTVIVNGKTVGEHQGGYDPFTVDITDALTTAGTQDLIVKVIDTTGQGNYPYQPRGKQSLTPGGIFYTSSSGIWQTVWLEIVPASYISDLLIVPDVDHQTVSTSPCNREGRLYPIRQGIASILRYWTMRVRRSRRVTE